MGRVCIDSGSVDEVVQEMVIRDRRHLSEDGIVLPIIAINRHTGRMENPPEIVSRGFALAEDNGQQFIDQLGHGHFLCPRIKVGQDTVAQHLPSDSTHPFVIGAQLAIHRGKRFGA